MSRVHLFSMIAVVFPVAVCLTIYRSVWGTGRTESAEVGSAKQRAGGPDAVDARELTELRQEIAWLNAQVRVQGRRLATAPARVGAVEPTQDPRTDPEVRARLERERRDYITGVEAAFHSESTDPTWSSTTSSLVHVALAADGDLTELQRGVECRSRSCRVVIADDGSVKLGKLLAMFAQQVGQALPSVVADHVAEPGGGSAMVLYMSRRGDAEARSP